MSPSSPHHGFSNLSLSLKYSTGNPYLLCCGFFLGLQRCGKSYRPKWTNYLKPDIKKGKFSLQEEQTIIQLHALLGNSNELCIAMLTFETQQL
ncbi:hypothetical protein LguiA_005060 [Lonicera macranthoides]